MEAGIAVGHIDARPAEAAPPVLVGIHARADAFIAELRWPPDDIAIRTILGVFGEIDSRAILALLRRIRLGTVVAADEIIAADFLTLDVVGCFSGRCGQEFPVLGLRGGGILQELPCEFREFLRFVAFIKDVILDILQIAAVQTGLAASA
jgi:hypothetical protein